MTLRDIRIWKKHEKVSGAPPTSLLAAASLLHRAAGTESGAAGSGLGLAQGLRFRVALFLRTHR